MTKKNLINISLTILFSIIIAFLIHKKIIYPTIIPMVKNSLIYLFADWSVIINASNCAQNGVDVYVENPCDPWGRKHVYGNIFLFIPILESLNKFYLFYFPIILNVLFIFVIVSFFNNIKNNKNYLSIFFILSAPFLLAIERANLDIVIFLIMFLISKYKNLFLNYFLIIFATLAKFYPILFGILFLFKKNFKKILIDIFILSTFLLIFVFFQNENILKIFNNQSQFSGSGIYQFSIKGLLNIIENTTIKVDQVNFEYIKYLLVIFFIIVPIIFTYRSIFKNIKKNENLTNIFEIDTFENRIYIASSIILLFCYFSIQNFFYREIFFLGLIPWILKIENKDSKFINFYFYSILFKFLFSTILIYLVMSNSYFLINPLLIFLKHAVDLYLISIIFLIFVGNLFYNLKKKSF